jgi:hypothetical protein
VHDLELHNAKKIRNVEFFGFFEIRAGFDFFGDWEYGQFQRLCPTNFTGTV